MRCASRRKKLLASSEATWGCRMVWLVVAFVAVVIAHILACACNEGQAAELMGV